MKQELPFAIVLLAAGGFLWAGQVGFKFQALFPSIRGSKALTAANSQPPRATSEPRSVAPEQGSSVAQVSYQAGVGQGMDQGLGQTSQSAEVPDITPLTHQNSTANLATAAFLRSVGTTLRNSPPFKSDLQITLNWSGQPYQISGEYSQPGQGSGQSKIELDLTTGGKPLKMTKVCDGRFLYTHLIRHDKQTLQFIDLRRLQETRSTSGLGQIDSPMSWVATGGLASAFENLSAAFEFKSIVPLQMEGPQVCQIEGRWNPKHLALLLHDAVDPNVLIPEIQWSKIPPQIPQSVIIELANIDSYGWVPQRIKFYRSAQVSDQRNWQPLASIEFSPPVLIVIDSKEFWKIETDEIESLDVTDQYVEQVRDFDCARTAFMESETIVR